MTNRPIAVFIAAVIALSGSHVSAQPLTGAIFTTDRDGTVVNGNIYADCCEVFLNGGPPPNAPCSSAGLPDGEYYFQVTNPSGKILLSSDPIEQRRIRVEGGLIVEYLGAFGPCVHETGLGKCNAENPANISVQLMPYAPTPNPGGVYKVWITRVSDYDLSRPNNVHGFRHSRSKTDNFKCSMGEPPPPPPPPPPPSVCPVEIKKYDDSNSNGSYDTGEIELDGIRFDVCYTPPGGQQTCITVTSGESQPGVASLNIPQGSTVVICEQIPMTGNSSCHWMQTQPHQDTPSACLMNDQWCYCLTIDCGAKVYFGNVCVCDASTSAIPVSSWATPQGAALLEGTDAEWRSILSQSELRKPNGKRLKVSDGPIQTSAAELLQWFAADGNGNMAHQLSIQLAATQLSAACMDLSGNCRVVIPADLADQLGFNNTIVSIKTLIKRAKLSLASHGLTVTPSPAREYQQELSRVLEGVTNNDWPMAGEVVCDVVYD